MKRLTVRYDDDGNLDEIVTSGEPVHLERMHPSEVWIGIGHSDGTWGVWLWVPPTTFEQVVDWIAGHVPMPDRLSGWLFDWVTERHPLYMRIEEG